MLANRVRKLLAQIDITGRNKSQYVLGLIMDLGATG